MFFAQSKPNGGLFYFCFWNPRVSNETIEKFQRVCIRISDFKDFRFYFQFNLKQKTQNPPLLPDYSRPCFSDT